MGRPREGRPRSRVLPRPWPHRDHPAYRVVPAGRSIRAGSSPEGLGREAGGRAVTRLRGPATFREHLLARKVRLAELRRLRGGGRWGAGPVPDARALYVLGRSLRRLRGRGCDPESPVRAHEARRGLGGVRELRPAPDAGRSGRGAGAARRHASQHRRCRHRHRHRRTRDHAEPCGGGADRLDARRGCRAPDRTGVPDREREDRSGSGGSRSNRHRAGHRRGPRESRGARREGRTARIDRGQRSAHPGSLRRDARRSPRVPRRHRGAPRRAGASRKRGARPTEAREHPLARGRRRQPGAC